MLNQMVKCLCVGDDVCSSWRWDSAGGGDSVEPGGGDDGGTRGAASGESARDDEACRGARGRRLGEPQESWANGGLHLEAVGVLRGANLAGRPHGVLEHDSRSTGRAFARE